MNSDLSLWIETSLSWLVTYAIHSTILILAVWLLCRGIRATARHIGPQAENRAWKLALVGGFVTATVQLALGVQPALGAVELGTRSGESVAVATSAAGMPAAAQPMSRLPRVIKVSVPGAAAAPVPFQPGPSRSSGGVTVLVPGVGTPSAPPPVPMMVVPTASLAQTPLGAASPAGSSALLWPKVVFAAWLLGTIFALSWLAVRAWRLRRQLGDRREVLEDPVLETFLTLCRDAGLSRKVRLSQSSRLDSPIALGRCEVVLPERAIAELSPAAMRSVLAHELAHLERRDPQWLALAAFIEALAFFQPLNRVARRGMQESAELLSDDWAIAYTGDGLQFAKALAEVASWERSQRVSPLVAGMISRERPLVRRVRRALDGGGRTGEDGWQPGRLFVSLAGLCALILLAPGAVSAGPPAQDDAGPADARRSEVASDRNMQATSASELRRERRDARRLERDRRRAEQQARRARDKARRAQQKAREATRSAREAQREADRAEREAARTQREAAWAKGPAPDVEVLFHEDDIEVRLDGEGGFSISFSEVIVEGEDDRDGLRVSMDFDSADLGPMGSAEDLEVFVRREVERELKRARAEIREARRELRSRSRSPRRETEQVEAALDQVESALDEIQASREEAEAAREQAEAAREQAGELREQVRAAAEAAHKQARAAAEAAREQAEAAREQFEDEAERAREQANEAADRARDQAYEDADQAREQAYEAADQAREQARKAASEARKAAREAERARARARSGRERARGRSRHRGGASVPWGRWSSGWL